MAISSRGKIGIGIGAAAAVGIVAALLIPGGDDGNIISDVVDIVAPDPICPLTGVRAAGEEVPARPVLAVKIENSTSARPQAGLNDADIVYEEPVEGGITRFIAIYHCADVERLGPIRSARTNDPEVLVQYGVPLFAYSGAAGPVIRLVAESGVTDINYSAEPDAYYRDDAREMPHDVFASSDALWSAATWDAAAPEPVLVFDEELPDPPTGKQRWPRALEVHLPYSGSSDVYWRWSEADAAWLRFHGSEPHLLEGDEQVSAATVIVQVIEVRPGSIVDAAGNPSPEMTLIGSGPAYVFRDGVVLRGTWVRASVDEVTRFLTEDGREIPMVPGRTWIELLPSTVDVGIAKRQQA